jgi:DNA-binding NarL/FixJ family response regulator
MLRTLRWRESCKRRIFCLGQAPAVAVPILYCKSFTPQPIRCILAKDSWGPDRRGNEQTRITDAPAVLIVRSEAKDRELLTELLDRHGIFNAAAATGDEALVAVVRARPAVVLIDVELKDAAGYELCRQLRERHGEGLGIIFLSAGRTAALDRVAGLLIGADDYVVEPFDPDELVARVRRCLSRSSTPADEPKSASDRRPLTGRERQVLGMLAAGLAQPAIAEALVISPKTVATHIQRILMKLEVHSRAQAVGVAYREGLISGAPADGLPQGTA